MSYTALIEFKNNIASEEYAFRNSWGGASRIWDSLFEAYIAEKSDIHPNYDNWLEAANDGRLWKLGRDERLTKAEKIAYGFCCDNALIKSENFSETASALREFVRKYPVASKGDTFFARRVCHLEKWAEVFDKSEGEAIGLYATSVGENPWFGWNEEKDESEPYDLSKGDKHWFLFEELDRMGYLD